MNNQTLMDLIALSLTDLAMIDLFESQRKFFESGCGPEHEIIMHLIVKAIDNTYGEGSFDLFKDTEILPSQR